MDKRYIAIVGFDTEAMELITIPPEAPTMEWEEAYKRGHQNALRGVLPADCPYIRDDLVYQWDAGYDRAVEEQRTARDDILKHRVIQQLEGLYR